MVEFEGIERERDRRVTVALDAADGVPAMKRLHDGQSVVVDVPKDRVRRATPHWRVKGEFPLA